MKRLMTVCAAVLLLFGIGLAPVLSEDKKDPMAEWAEMNKPGDNHKLLEEYFGGDFNLKIKMWMDPKGDPMLSEGTSKGEMLFGGRYLRQDITMIHGGDPKMESKGWSFIGYDNSNKQFVHTFIGDMGTSLDRFTGKYDEKAKTITFEGQGFIEGMGSYSSRIVVSLISKDEHKLEIFTKYVKNDEYKEMELIGTRKK
ncbi:MAG: DUF1579 family protein [Planctomycetes bacterium]|nr:DUF1579 family protein [Planctomycetota bacterium]